MSDCNHDCSSCGESCSEREPGSLLAKLSEGSSVKKVIGIVSGKGGVGKSMVTSQLAMLSERRGYRTAVLDADITGSFHPQGIWHHRKGFRQRNRFVPRERNERYSGHVRQPAAGAANTDPVLWRGPIIGSVVTQFWTDSIGMMWTICLSICLPEPATLH